MRVIPFTLCGCLLALGLISTLKAQEAALVPPVVPPAAVPADPSVSPLPKIPSPDVVPELTRADAEAWLDGYLPYALDNGDIAGAVVVVKDGQVLLQKGNEGAWSSLSPLNGALSGAQAQVAGCRSGRAPSASSSTTGSSRDSATWS